MTPLLRKSGCKLRMMTKRPEILGVLLTLLAVFGFILSWKFFFAREQKTDIPDYQARLAATAENLALTANSSEASLKIYAVNVIGAQAFKSPSIGYGVYLGRGVVLTAAHFVGRYPFAASPHVLIAGKDLPAKVIKQDPSDRVDLALLAVDERQLPVSLRLRLNPICNQVYAAGTNVVVVYPERAMHSRMISPALISPQLRTLYPTLLNDTYAAGSGVFQADKKCLLGMMNRDIPKFGAHSERRHLIVRQSGYAGYFVPASAIVNFVRIGHAKGGV